MYTTVTTEAQFFLLSILAGIASAFLYDLLRISRRIVRVNDIVINAEDIIFFASAAVFVFIAAYMKNSGEIRWQSFIGFALGIALYILIVRDRLLNVSTVIIKYIVKVIGILLSVILFPFRLIMKIFRKPISVVAWYSGKGIRRVKSSAKKRRIRFRLMLKNILFMFGKQKK